MANLATIDNNILADSGIDPIDLIVGTGTVNYVPKFTAEGTIGNSQIFDNGTNVGIGTASPSYKLEVIGSFSFTTGGNYLQYNSGILYHGNYYQFPSGNNYLLFARASGDLVFGANDVERMRITSSGNVGIGTSAPNYKLDVNGSINIYSGNSLRWGSGDVEILNSGYSLLFSTYTGSALTEKMRVTSTGNVGIGTIIPTSRLHALLSGNTSGGPIGNVASFQNSSVGNNAYITLFGAYDSESGIVFTDESEQFKGKLAYNNNNEYMYFQTDGSERMRITSAGNVGIGTSSPLGNLDIYQAANPSLYIRDNSSIIRILPFGGITYFQTATSLTGESTTDLYFSGMFGTPVNMVIKAGGNVGIGTTTPTYKLEANGNIASLNSSAAGLFSISGTRSIAVQSFSADWNYLRSNGAPLVFGTQDAQGLYIRVNDIDRITVNTLGAVRFNNYGSGSFTGTPTYNLAVDANGNIIETAGGVVDGSGTANYVTKWIDANTVGNSQIFDNGTNVGIGTASPSYKLTVNGTISASQILLNQAVYTNVAQYETGAGTWGGGYNFDLNNGSPRHALTGGLSGVWYNTSAILWYANDGQGAGTLVSEKMRLTSAGNVGIGTSSPAQKLDVVGAGVFGTHTTSRGAYSNGLALQNNTGEATSLFLWQSGVASAHIGSPANSTSLHIVNSYNTGLITDPNAIVLTNTGNVGIGTTAPSAKFVVSDGGASGIELQPEQTTDTNRILNYDRATATYMNLRVDANTHQFMISGSERMRLDSSGNLGIGTSSPVSPLDVNGILSSRGIFIAQNSGTYNLIYNASNSVAMYIGGSADPATYYDNLYHYFRSTAGSTTYGVWNSTGLGVGTSSPSTKLHVVGYVRTDGGMIVNGSDANYREIIFTTSSASRWNLYTYGAEGGANSGSVLFLARYADNGDYIANVATFLRTNGYVGIATTSPTEQLHVSGNLRVTGAYYDSNNSAGTSGQVLSSTATGTDWVSLSEITGVDGTGTANYIAKWLDANTITNSLLYDDGTNVGIGTTTPAYKLDVAGASRSDLHIFRSNQSAPTADAFIFRPADNTVALGTANTERLRINASGNVGIGTSSPVSIGTGVTTLDIQGSSAGGVAFGPSGIKNYIYGASTMYIEAHTTAVFATSGSEKMRITSIGRVGIGTSNPATKLHVVNTADVAIIGDGNDNFFGNYTSGDYFDIGNLGSTGNVFLEGRGVSTNINSQYRTKGAGSHIWTYNSGANEIMRTTSTGNVGIGTTDPQYKLDVAQVIRSNYGSNEGRLYLGSTPAGVGYAAGAIRATPSPSYSYTGKLSFYTTTWGVGSDYGITEQMYIDTTAADTKAATLVMLPWGGNVGINTTNPAAKLHVVETSNSATTYPLIINNQNNQAGDGWGAGIKFSTSNPLGGGNEGLKWSSIQAFDVNNYGSSSGLSFTVSETYNKNTAMVINRYGAVGIGTTTPVSKLEVYDGDISVTTANSFSYFNSNRNFIPNSSGVSLGALRYRGYSTGSTYQVGAGIWAYSQEAWSASNAASYLSFQTTPSGSTAPVERMILNHVGQLRLTAYGSGTFTGTRAYDLSVDASGNIIEVPVGAGTITGSGTTNYLPKFTSASAIGNSQVFDNGTDVAIGTDSPFVKFDVRGEAILLYRPAANAYAMYSAANNSYSWQFGINNGSDYIIWGGGFTAPGTERFRITSGGNVGIGTSNPFNKLTVGSVPASGYGLITISSDWASGTAISTGIKIGAANDTGGAGVDIRSHSNYAATSGTEMSFWTNSTGNALYERMRITNAGNVGIGTTNPYGRLHLTGDYDGAQNTLNLENNWPNTYSTSLINFWAYYNAVNPMAVIEAGQDDSATNAGVIIFKTMLAGAAPSTRMIIRPSGDVGIGTTTPLRKLHVAGNFAVNANGSQYYGVYIPANGEGASPTILIGDWWNASGNLTWDSSNKIFNINSLYGSNAAPITFSGNGTERMRITTAGDVGIGISSPITKLQVAGGVTVGSSSTAIVNFYMTRNNGGVAADANYFVSANNTPNHTWIEGGYYTGELSGVVTAPNSGYPYIETWAGQGGSTTKSFGFINKTSGSFTAADLFVTMSLARTGLVRFNQYGTGAFTGTRAYDLSVDASGNIIEVPVGAGTITGSGTANYIPRFTSSSAIGNSNIYDDGTNVGISTTSPLYRLDIGGTARAQGITLTAFATGTSGGNLELGFDGAQGVVQAYNRSTPAWIPLYLSGSDVRFNPGGVEKMRLTSTGNLGIETSSPATKFTIGAYVGSRLPYINGTTSTFNAQGITVTSSNTANANIGGGLDLTNNVHSVGSYSPLISFSALSQSGLYNNNYAAIYGVLAGDSGDGNWNTGHIAFATTTAYGTSEKVRITSAGNVGIGTTTPSYKLVVNGAEAGLYVNGAEVAPYTQKIAVFRYGGNGNSVNIENQAGKASIQGRVDSGAVMDLILNAAGGNVGIGTGSPQTGVKLDVYGAAAVAGGSEGLRIGNVGDNAAYDNIKIYYTGYNGGAPRVYMTPRTTPGSGVVNTFFHLQNTNGSSTTSNNTMGLLVDGNVGIGTISPTTPLEISHATGNALKIATNDSTTNNNAGVVIENVASSISTTRRSVFIMDPTSGTGTGGDYFYITSYGNGLTSLTNAKSDGILVFGTADSERMRITSSGNVGIGTSAPNEKLDVRGNIYIPQNNYIYFDNSGHYIRRGASDVEIQGYNGIQLRTSGTTRLYINEIGNVGIGTTAPSYKFVVNDSTTDPIAYFGTAPLNASSRNALIILQSGTIPQHGSDTTGEVGFLFKHSYGTGGVNGTANGGYIESIRESVFGITSQVNTALIFGTSSANIDGERMRITSGGNVGIGTTNPTYKLDVNGSIRTSGVGGLHIDASANFGDNSGANFDILNLGSTRALRILATSNNGWGNILLNAYGGNVAIGTTAPTANLHVNSSSNTYVKVSSSSGTDYAGVQFENSGDATHAWSMYRDAIGNMMWSHSTGATIGQGTTTYPMVITTGDNVGIGTTAPNYKLEVQGSVGINGTTIPITNNTYTLGGGSNKWSQIWGARYFADDGSANAPSYSFAGDQDSGIWKPGDGILAFSTNGVERMRITSGGEILINTTSDAGDYKLQVNGNIYSSGDEYLEGSLYIQNGGGGSAQIYGSSADGVLRIRNNNIYVPQIQFLKSNGTVMFDLNNGVASFTGSVTATGFFESSDARLKTIVDENYRHNAIANIKPKFYEKNGKFEAGYIAQDVQEIYEHAVSLGTDGYLSLSYGQIHTLKIAYLEDTVEEIKRKIAYLEQQLNNK